jgi:23S rRNA (cytidine1920-2'-O)/16S rRNA (cytidine1409-2'-O)-methyltransferase
LAESDENVTQIRETNNQDPAGGAAQEVPIVTRRVPLVKLLGRLEPPVVDAEAALREQRVLVDGAVVTNPGSLVLPTARVVIRPRAQPRGARKLGAALDRFGVDPAGRVGLDLGACTGGFTQALLDRGAVRVFAVDVGHGQLLGSLRQDPRVVSLERTNVADVTPELLGTRPQVIVADVTKLPLREVARQLATQDVPGPGTELVGLVKPMFELGTGQLPVGPELALALDRAERGIAESGWDHLGSMESPMRGHRGAVEFFVHARWP